MYYVVHGLVLYHIHIYKNSASYTISSTTDSFKPTNALPVVNVTIFNRIDTFLVDTGSSYSLLSNAYRNRAQKLTDSNFMTFKAVNGSEITVYGLL